MNRVDEWVKTCLRKKKLSEYHADEIIKRAKIELRKYYCPHCFYWYITKKKLN